NSKTIQVAIINRRLQIFKKDRPPIRRAVVSIYICRLIGSYLRADQVEGALDEDRHLCAGDGAVGAVVAAAAAAGDAFRSQLLDPSRSRRRERDAQYLGGGGGRWRVGV